MAPTKEPTQETPAVTILPISPIMAARVPAAGVGVVKTPHFKKYLQPDNSFNYPDCNKKKSETNKITNRLRKKKSREFFKEPKNKSLHITHGLKHLPNGKGNKSQEQGERRNKAIHSPVGRHEDSLYSHCDQNIDTQR